MAGVGFAWLLSEKGEGILSRGCPVTGPGTVAVVTGAVGAHVGRPPGLSGLPSSESIDRLTGAVLWVLACLPGCRPFAVENPISRQIAVSAVCGHFCGSAIGCRINKTRVRRQIWGSDGILHPCTPSAWWCCRMGHPPRVGQIGVMCLIQNGPGGPKKLTKIIIMD